MGAHLIDGEFQSDKYPTTPRNKVPLSVKDKDAQDLLFLYAQRHRSIDPEFSDDLIAALKNAGYEPKETLEEAVKVKTAKGVAKWIKGAVAGSMFGSMSWSLRQQIADCIERGTWCDREINRDDSGPR